MSLYIFMHLYNKHSAARLMLLGGAGLRYSVVEEQDNCIPLMYYSDQLLA